MERGGGRGKTIQSGMVVNEETPQEEQEPGLLPQSNNLSESSNDENSDDEEENGTNCKPCMISWIELTEK